MDQGGKMKQFNQQLLNQIGQQPKKTATTTYSHDTVTLQHVVEGQALNLPLDEWLNAKFNEAFQSKWNKKALPSTWKTGLQTMTIEQIRIAVSRSLLEGDGWPPSLPEFIKMGKDNGIDYDESFDRFINARTQEDKNNLNDVEYFTAQEVGDRCRTRLPEDKARALWKKTQAKYAKRAEDGALPNRQQKAIAHTKKTVGKDWLGPDGNYYTCPAEYYANKINTTR